LERLLPSSRTVAKQWAGKSHVDEVDSSLRCFSSRKQENCFYFEDYEATLWKKRLTAVMSSPPKEKTETKAGHLPAGNVTVMLLISYCCFSAGRSNVSGSFRQICALFYLENLVLFASL